MEGSKKIQDQPQEEEKIDVSEEEVEQLIQCLPKSTTMGGEVQVLYQGFWYRTSDLKHILTYQRHFKARDSDLIIASFPKTGNTWLKALLFTIVNRNSATTTQNQNPLLNKSPHQLVHYLDLGVYRCAFEFPRPHHLDQLPSPRLFHTHLPYHSLPQSITTSECRILYITRNPFDTFVSLFYFLESFIKKGAGDNVDELHLPSVEEFMEGCWSKDPSLFDVFFDHVVEYWKKSLEQSNKIMFLMYEDLKEDPVVQVKKIAEFIGLPFSDQEESEGVVDGIIEMCSFNNLKNLEVNKSGIINKVNKSSFFRKGEVGDGAKKFPPAMVDRLNKLMEAKLGGTGISF